MIKNEYQSYFKFKELSKAPFLKEKMTEEEKDYQLLVTDIQSELFPILMKYRKYGDAIIESLQWFCDKVKWGNEIPQSTFKEKI